MANQAIALGVRGPQVPDIGRSIQQNAQLINMMAQQRAAERQTAREQQTMDIQARIAEPQFAKAQSEAQAASIKTAMDFNNFVRTAIPYAANPQQAVEIAQRIAQQPQFQAPEFQGAIATALQNLPEDPAQFEEWKVGILSSTMDADKQLAREFQRQTTGREERIISMPKYGMGAAVEVPGSRIQAAEDIQYVRGPNGEIIPMPKTVPGTGGAVDTGLVTGGADTVYGFGQYGRPSKPLTQMTIGEVQDFQRGTLIPATRGKVGAGPDKGTGAVGTYQIVYSTLQQYAPRVLGPNWRNTPFTAEVQDRIARAIYEDVKSGNLKDTWAGMPNNRPGEYANVPWEQVRSKIAQVETGGGAPRGTGVVMGRPLPGTTKTEVTAPAKRQVSTIIAKVRNAYEQLNSREAIPSEQRGAVSNIFDYLASTGIGREAQRALGTKNNKLLTDITSSRKLLATAIKNATGMSAQEMNSNVELQLMLDALTDPTQGYEAAISTLNTLEELYGTPRAAPAAGARRETERGSDIDALLRKYGG